jgi:hypothetical protein
MRKKQPFENENSDSNFESNNEIDSFFDDLSVDNSESVSAEEMDLLDDDWEFSDDDFTFTYTYHYDFTDKDFPIQSNYL